MLNPRHLLLFVALVLTHSFPSFSALLVFQGEVGFSRDENGKEETKILTPAPTTCNVIAFFNKKTHTAALAHIDDYTSVESLIDYLENTFESRFHLSMKRDEFYVQFMGGSEASYSVGKKNQLLETLRQYKPLKIQMVPIDRPGKDRPQIAILPEASSTQLLRDKHINLMLELVQQCEYGDFNKLFLDFYYGDVKGEDIPEFKIKEATRHESDLPIDPNITVIVQGKGQLEGLQRLSQLEAQKLLIVNTKYKREVYQGLQPLEELSQQVAKHLNLSEELSQQVAKDLNLSEEFSRDVAKYLPLSGELSQQVARHATLLEELNKLQSM